MNFLHSNTLSYKDCLELDPIDKKCYLVGDEPQKIFREVIGRDPTQQELDNLIQNHDIGINGKPYIDLSTADAKAFLTAYAYNFGGTAAEKAQQAQYTQQQTQSSTQQQALYDQQKQILDLQLQQLQTPPQTSESQKALEAQQKQIMDLQLQQLQEQQNFDPVAAAKAQADAMVQATEEGYAKLATEYNQRYKDFETANPFNFDQILAEESNKVGERLDPYYKQTLNDYLKGVNTRRQRSLEDERTLLTDLQKDTDQYTGNEKIALDMTLERTRQGYADAGLYFSGNKQRAEGMATGESKRGLSDYLRGQEGRQRDIQTTGKRSLEDIQLEQSQKQRDLGSFDPTTGNYVRGVEPTYQIKSEALNEANRRQQLLSYEKSQFLGAAPGVNYSTYQQNSNNTLLNALS